MIQLSTPPMPGPIDIGRPAAPSPLGTASLFTLALADLAVAGAAPAVAAPATGLISLPLPTDAVRALAAATPGLQDPAATGSELPSAPAMPEMTAGMTVAFEDTPATAPAPAPAPTAAPAPAEGRPPAPVVADPRPAGDATPTRPVLNEGMPDLPNVCTADLPVDGQAPAAPPPTRPTPLHPDLIPVVIAVAAPVAAVVLAPPGTKEAPPPLAPGVDIIPPTDAAPIAIRAPAMPGEAVRATTPDAEIAPRMAMRRAVTGHAAADDDASASSSDAPDKRTPDPEEDTAGPATASSGPPPPAHPNPPVAAQPIAAPSTSPQGDPVAGRVVETQTPPVASGRASPPPAATPPGAPPGPPAPPTTGSTRHTITAGEAGADRASATEARLDAAPPGTDRPLPPLPAKDAAPKPHPIRDARPMPSPAPSDVRPALTPGPAMPKGPVTIVDRPPAALPTPAPMASGEPQPALPAVRGDTAGTGGRRPAPEAPAPVTIAAAPAVTTTPAPPQPAPPATAQVPAPAERAPTQDAPRTTVTVTVAAPAASPATPSMPQPAAQAFAAAMFAFAEDRGASPRGDALLSDIAASLSLGGVGTPTAPAATAAHDLRLPVVDTTRSDWMEKMIDRIETIRGESGGSETRIRLTPDALGNVEVSVTRDASGAILLRMTSDNPHARALLAEAAPRLAEMAEARGLKLGGSGVDSHGGGQQGERQPATPAPRPPLRPARAGNDMATMIADTRLA